MFRDSNKIARFNIWGLKFNFNSHYCNANREKIKKLANEVYNLGLKEETRNKFNICDFKKLEEKCLEYIELE